MIVSKFYKAQRIGDQKIDNQTITFTTEMPYFKKEPKELDTIFDKQAEALENILYSVLPGGTYSELLSKMLKRRASHFVVSFGRTK